MADSVNVREIQTLSDLRNALGRFAESSTQSLQAFDAEIRRALEWLRERVLYWQRELERARINVQRAEAALHHCESQVYVDRDGHAHYPDCSQYRRALQQAQQVLARAEQNLAVATRWQSSVGQAAKQYETHSVRMKQITTTQTDRAKSILGRKTRELQQYAKMDQGVLDLSSPRAWGNFAHDAYEERAEEVLGARSEVRVRVTRTDGSQGIGRIDSLASDTIIDYKTHDLAALAASGRLESTLGDIADQLERYRNSPDVPTGATMVVVFEFPPSEADLRSSVEDFFAERGISVLWQ